MIKENILTKLFKKEGIDLFKTITSLDVDNDVFLDKADPGEIIQLCRCMSEQVAFYCYFEEVHTDNIDLEKMKTLFKKYIDEEFFSGIHAWSVPIEDDDIDRIISNYDAEVADLIKEYNTEQAGRDNDNTQDTLVIYIIHAGKRIGVLISDDIEDVDSDLSEFNKAANDIQERMLQDVISLYEERKHEEQEKREREKEEWQERYNTAIQRIRDEIQSSDEILSKTNAKLRHSYAKNLVNKYSDEYDVYITIGEIDVLVDTEYKARKNKESAEPNL